ncbi:MAG: GNAT family N-acetyltransferase [Deltaproteobacteria bacterium]|nr:MAG: GNAT family N-acetyltransferase [Deltaproteobacteria bacterium]
MSIEVAPLSHDHLDEAVALLEASTPFDLAARVAEEKLFGGAPAGPARAFGARRAGDLAGIVVTSGRWLRLFVVAPRHLGHGIGRALLDAAEADLRARGEARARTMDQPGNYLAPGIDERNAPTIEWFRRRGYAPVRRNTSLEIDLRDNPNVSAARARALAEAAAARGYQVRRASRADRAALRRTVAGAFSEGWAFEVDLALSTTPEGVHVAVAPDGTIAAFAAHDGNNRGLGWFGPAGTLPEHRGRGLGSALLVACLEDVRAAGHRTCVVSWIGPRAFYDRVAGVAGERHYVVLEKAL